MHKIRKVHTKATLLLALSLVPLATARAQTPSPIAGPSAAPTGASTVLPAITVTAPAELERQPTDAASEQRFSGETLNTRPISRPAEILEATPGLIVTQHSGEGKANQYFLRGFNLDHGTDISIWLDGMPINMPTHAHGQGYADLNFLIPELVESLTVRKGPYWAQEGDFSSAGALRLLYADRLEKDLVSATGGSFGYWRGLAAGTMPAGNGFLTGAFEIERYDGPWQIPDAVRKYNGVLSYSEGTRDNGLSITAMAYTNSWHSTDQVPQRAVFDGSIGRFSGIDPTDGGDSQRYSLSGRWGRKDETTTDKIEAYFIYSTLNLYNNFTYFLNDPDNGDQFQQSDKRRILGLTASHAVKHKLLGYEAEGTIGLQLRYDNIDVGLFNTFQRTPLSTIRTDHVNETSAGLYFEEKVQWNRWLRSTLGMRGDMYWATDESSLSSASSQTASFLPSPKLGLVFGPFDKTEFYLNAGFGFHSNDVRGIAQGAPLLVRSRGAEIGARMQAIKGLDSTLSIFILEFDSELVFSGDAGDTEPSRASRRIGVEWTNRYRPISWATFDADFAYTYARFQDTNNPVGDYIPQAPAVVASAGITLGEDTGWFGAMRWRFFGARPLIEDGSVWSGATSLFDARVGYTFQNGLKLTLDVLNLLNTQADQVSYYYTSRLPGEPLAGVNDVHFHPVEPIALRFTVAKAF
ncbi:MAG: TonB-dependent receptor [Alphaproteobacteria bacterium]|nr:TonB-dependent receptor [Alphaproteobacteria bacterium]